MRGTALLVSAAACLLAVSSPGPAAGWHQADKGTSVETEDGEVDIGVWIEVDIPGASEPDANPDDPSMPPCYFRQGNYAELNAWLENDYVAAPDPDETYILKLCKTEAGTQLVTFWVYQPAPPKEPPPPTMKETIRLRNEAWGRLAIPEPTTLTAPREVTIVHLPTYVWVPAAARTPVSETVTTTLDGHELTLTATAFPRRLGFLRVAMGDGTTLWCDADHVVAFNHSRDPLDQPSNCFHYYRQSSVSQPDLRYQVALTAYWDVSVACVFNGGPCTNPPPVVPTQVLTASPHPIAVAEIQALASPG
ncbi:hypothetical protein [Candidatus Poriferisocius sp.]|uniref:hypothetical protein n=1 Tax=Candidatus Poriferisocius sp. TaxID=3101276 RepID=UPI003B022ACA